MTRKTEPRSQSGNPTGSPAPAAPRPAIPPEYGFYARQFERGELEDLEALRGRLFDEIAALRITARRMLELSNQLDDPRLVIQSLAALGVLLSRVGGLLRAQESLGGDQDQVENEITLAIQEASAQLGWPAGLPAGQPGLPPGQPGLSAGQPAVQSPKPRKEKRKK